MPISECISLPYIYKRPLPDFQNGEDIKFPDTLVEFMLKKFTSEGDKILDPFTGLGTTFFASEKMKRIPFGVEADDQRYNWVKERVVHPENLILGDSADLLSYNFPKMDFSITSPPYMPHHHKWNPLYAGNPKFSGYGTYLKRMTHIYQNVCMRMKKNATIIVQADNLTNKEFSPLVWDLGKALSNIMSLEGEILVKWTRNKENSNQFTQCLVFKNK